MAARNSWAVQAAGPTGLITVEDARVALGALAAPGSSGIVARSGFRPGAGATPGAVTATGTPDAFVHVAPFQLFYQTTRASVVGGPYMMTLDAIANVNILSTPADPTNPRNDLVIAQQSDTFYGDGVSTWQIRQVVGTPSGSPVDPTVSGSTDYVPLARVRVNANATTITTGNITDLRSSGHAKSLTGGLFTTALGGLLPVANTTERGGLTPYVGMQIWRVDVGWNEIYDGATWQAQGYWRARQTLVGSAATVTFSSIPTGIRHLQLVFSIRGDNATTAQFMSLQLNGVGSSVYNYNFSQTSGGSVTEVFANAQGSAVIGYMPGSTAPANEFGSGVVDFPSWDLSRSVLNFNFSSGPINTISGGSFTGTGVGFAGVSSPYTSITLIPQTGNFIAGSDFQLRGTPA